jgi:hypothetical protein
MITTSPGLPSVQSPSGSEETQPREVAVRFEALLFESALKPLAGALGFFGEVALNATAVAMARAGHDPLQRLLERALAGEAHRATGVPL